MSTSVWGEIAEFLLDGSKISSVQKQKIKQNKKKKKRKTDV